VSKIRVVASERLAAEEAVLVGLEALVKGGQVCGVQTEIGRSPGRGRAVILGEPQAPSAESDADAYSIEAMPRARLEVRPNSVRALAYALVFLADRLMTQGRLPSHSVTREPAFKSRFTHVDFPRVDIETPPYVDQQALAAGVSSAKNTLRLALCWGANHILLHRSHLVVPWDDDVEGKRSEIYRAAYKELVDYAHALHLKVLAYDDEFLYLEDVLKKASATLSVEDPAFWDVLQDKYRGLFARLPELDGVGIRIGEMLPWGNFRAFDVIHNDSKFSLEEKYRLFIRKVHEVVVGEFGKLYYHRTWVTNDWEQHSVDKIFKPIFDDMPRDNLIVSIKLTKTDQWYWQALNPTLGLTDHATVVELEMHHGPHGAQAFPSFSGEWFRAGLNYALGRGAVGAMTGVPSGVWLEANGYAASRLLWDPKEDVRQVAKDWATIRFGKRAAAAVADALLLSYHAIHKGLYIMPYASTHAWNPLIHLLSGMFVAEGDPTLDEGLGHLAFLRDIYWQCRPFLADTMRELREGLRIWDKMVRRCAARQREIDDPEMAGHLEYALALGRSFIRLNVSYVEAFLKYFIYEESLSEADRRQAKAAITDLKRAIRQYLENGGNFQLSGIDEFTQVAERGLANPQRARQMVYRPSEQELRSRKSTEMQRQAAALESADRSVKLLYWEGSVDGREMLIVGDREVQIEHMAAEPPADVKYEFFEPLPKGWRVVLKPLEVRGYAFVYGQPNERNGWQTSVLVDDPEDGRAIYRFELHAVPPEERVA